jgi:hypothetical protein
VKLFDETGFQLPAVGSMQWANHHEWFSITTVSTNGTQVITIVDLSDPSNPTMHDVPHTPSGQGRQQASWSPDDTELVVTGLAYKSYKAGTYRVSVNGSSSPIYLGPGIRPSWWPGLPLPQP